MVPGTGVETPPRLSGNAGTLAKILREHAPAGIRAKPRKVQGAVMAKQHALGIDFGGTKLLAAVIDLDSGEVVSTAKKRTSAADSPQTIIDKIHGAADDALQSAKMKPKQLVGIGVGAAGQVDADKGVLLGTPNLSQAVIDLPITESLRKRFGVPAALRNDVQVA